MLIMKMMIINHDDDVDGDDDAVDGWGRELSHLVSWNHQQDHDQNVDNDGGGDDDDDAIEAAADDDDAVERDLANWCIRMTQLGRHLKTPINYHAGWWSWEGFCNVTMMILKMTMLVMTILGDDN